MDHTRLFLISDGSIDTLPNTMVISVDSGLPTDRSVTPNVYDELEKCVSAFCEMTGTCRSDAVVNRLGGPIQV